LVIEQIYQIGVRSTGLVMITAAFTGMVMALQFGLGLEKFGGKLYVPKIVSLSIVREIAPVFCSLMLSGSSGCRHRVGNCLDGCYAADRCDSRPRDLTNQSA
jgi:phospholipid/cholesterol/gamma-HCH transport system permease protein